MVEGIQSALSFSHCLQYDWDGEEAGEYELKTVDEWGGHECQTGLDCGRYNAARLAATTAAGAVVPAATYATCATAAGLPAAATAWLRLGHRREGIDRLCFYWRQLAPDSSDSRVCRPAASHAGCQPPPWAGSHAASQPLAHHGWLSGTDARMQAQCGHHGGRGRAVESSEREAVVPKGQACLGLRGRRAAQGRHHATRCAPLCRCFAPLTGVSTPCRVGRLQRCQGAVCRQQRTFCTGVPPHLRQVALSGLLTRPSCLKWWLPPSRLLFINSLSRQLKNYLQAPKGSCSD